MVLPKVTTFDEARQIIREQAEEIEKLSNELAWFKRQMFGSKTELTAFILWPFSPSKKSPLDPPSPWSWLGAYR